MRPETGTRSSVGRHAAVALTACLLSGCSGAAPSPPPTSSPEPTSSTIQANFDVGGGRMMHIYCVGPVGSGRPTVIFEAGLGGGSLEWNPVLHELNGAVRLCLYDRAGKGRGRQSEEAPVGRTTSDQVADLHALLAAAGVPPPYVMVGFSLGGWNVMVYNDRYPGEVVSAVMVDVRPADFSRRSLEALPPQSPSEPAPIKEMRFDLTTFETDPTLNDEGLFLAQSATETIATADFGDKPVLVLVASDISENFADLDPTLAATLEAIWWELQDELVARSSIGRLVKVDTPEHDIPYDRPEAVVGAINELLGT